MTWSALAWVLAALVGGGGLGALGMKAWKDRRTEGMEQGRTEADKLQAQEDNRRKDDVIEVVTAQRDSAASIRSTDDADRVWAELREREADLKN